MFENISEMILEDRDEKGNYLSKFGKENPIFEEIVRNIPDELEQELESEVELENYIIRGSVGRGQWSAIPWIAIMDKEITKTPQEGVYLVFLFSHDMKRLYLSLNQGITYYNDQFGKNGINKARDVAQVIRTNLFVIDVKYQLKKINLNGEDIKTSLPLGYEAGHICGVEYNLSNMPDSRIIVEDMINMLVAMEWLKMHIPIGNYNTAINYMLDQSTLMSADEAEVKDINIDNYKNYTPKVFTSLMIDHQVDNISKKSKTKTNYIKQYRKNEKLGLLGELIILDYENRKLESLGFPEDKRAKHIPPLEGDRRGYDIESFNENGESIYIEVKTTKSDGSREFYFSSRELAVSKKLGDQYFVYRIFNLTKDSYDLFIHQGDLSNSDFFNIEPIVYTTTKK